MSVVIVTGASSGFGKDMAIDLASKGHHVFATMRNTETKNKEAVDELLKYASDNNQKIEVLELDVTEDESVNSAVSKISEKTNGQIDVLVNNAGCGVYGFQETYSIEAAKKMFEVNFFGIMRMNNAVLPFMRKQKSGLIINLSSGLGRLTMPFFGIYSASKFAVEGLSETLRQEMKPFNIDSVLIEPGAYPDTAFGAKMTPPDRVDVIKEYEELGLASKPNDLMGGFMGSMTEFPPTSEIIELVSKYIEMPYGTRPARVAKGNVAEMVHELNKVQKDIQDNVDQNMMAGLFD